jgi:major membrane immunogen (membrane-anchored lipoprotein)
MILFGGHRVVDLDLLEKKSGYSWHISSLGNNLTDQKITYALAPKWWNSQKEYQMTRLLIVCIGLLLMSISPCTYENEAVVLAEEIDGIHHAQITSLAADFLGTKKYEDGVFEASLPFGGKYNFDANAKITVKNGLIADVIFWERQQDTDRLKGNAYIESETKVWGEANRVGVTTAVAGMRQYPARLIVTQDIDKVDSISGATYSYKRFVLVVKKTLADALAK